MSARVLADADFRALVPDELLLPCEHSLAVVSVGLGIDDTGRVYAPGLDEIKAVLARGSTDVVRSYCEMWTRWLAKAGTQLAEDRAAVPS